MIGALGGSKRHGIVASRRADTPDTRRSRQPPRTEIALPTVLEVSSDSGSGSELPPGRPPSTVTETQAFRPASVRGYSPETQLPELMIHTPETLEPLALQFWDSPLPDVLVSTARKKTHERASNQSRWSRLQLWPERQHRAPLTAGQVQVYSPVRILLLGTSESGKSTLAKTMRAAHGDVDVCWLRAYSSTIVDNTIWALRQLVLKSREIRPPAQIPHRELSMDAEFFIMSRNFEELADAYLPGTSPLPSLAYAAQYLWDHPYIREAFEVPHATQLPGYYELDCAEQ